MKPENKKISRRQLLCAAGLAGALALLAGCGLPASIEKTESGSGKVKIVATIFPEYDFLRAVCGDAAELTLLLAPGTESHSYEPTPQDMIAIQQADLFVYVGGETDTWVERILSALDTASRKTLRLMDCVDALEEQTVEGMTAEAEPDGAAQDEHVWTSPKNAERIVQALCDAVCALDTANAELYRANTAAYRKELEALDDAFRAVTENAARREIIVGDRFPFRYLAAEYGLRYYAAFPGCSTDTECSAATIAFLTDKIKQDGIPVVFHTELSNEKVCRSLCEATGAAPMLLHAVHNISRADFEADETYLSLMENNVTALQEALN